MTVSKLFVLFTACAISLESSISRAATLYGDTVTASWSFDSDPTISEFNRSALVGAGDECL